MIRPAVHWLLFPATGKLLRCGSRSGGLSNTAGRQASSSGQAPGIGFEQNDEGDDMAGRSEADWNELAAEGRRILQGVARDGILIDYGDFNKELADATGLPIDLTTDGGRADISNLLVMIHERDSEEGNGYMLTSLVKLKGENYPGKGFFTLAQQEGLYDSAKEPELEFWSRQVRLAHQAHKRVRPGRS